MLIQISDSLVKKCKDKKYIWGNFTKPDSIICGNTWEVATQLFLGVSEKEVKLREGKRGADSGIDVIINGQKYQCKACLLDGVKNFILLDKTLNFEVDYYALGKVWEDFKQCELTAILKTSEMISLIDSGKIFFHNEYSKWSYLLGQNISEWISNQKKKKVLKEGVIQNLSCLIYK